MWLCNRHKGEKPTAILTVYDPVNLSSAQKAEIIGWLDNQKHEITNTENINEKYQAKLWARDK
jgi:hypothetical protein